MQSKNDFFFANLINIQNLTKMLKSLQIVLLVYTQLQSYLKKKALDDRQKI